MDYILIQYKSVLLWNDKLTVSKKTANGNSCCFDNLNRQHLNIFLFYLKNIKDIYFCYSQIYKIDENKTTNAPVNVTLLPPLREYVGQICC